jgi:N-dimethylarginine dimethylaminohydrolase
LIDLVCKVNNEWNTLRRVIVGIATSWGPNPTAQQTVDPKSREHILAGTYPITSDVHQELEGLVTLLKENGVEVLRPENTADLNQVFSRDVGVVIENKLIRSSMIAERAPEWLGVSGIFSHTPSENILTPPSGVRIEGGDIMPMDNEIWVGYSEEEDFQKYRTARTNKNAVVWLQEKFPAKYVRGFQLHKSDTDPRTNALHLDCCLCPLSGGQVIFHPEGLKLESEITWVRKRFAEKIYEADAEAMYNMHCNLLTISPDTIISGKGFERVNAQLRAWGYNVLEIPFNETSKLEGLFRCVTLPLIRN